MQNLERRPSGIYVARLTVPARLRSIVGARVFVESTGTSHLAMAKLIAGEVLAAWRRQLFELERLSYTRATMNDESIVKIADGHPLLKAVGYLPISQAAYALGLAPEDLLRRAADGQLSLFCRLTGDSGYLTSHSEFETDDQELGTVVVPGVGNRPRDSRLHRAFGAFKLLKDDAVPLASALLAGEKFVVLVVELLEPQDGLNIHVLERSMHLDQDRLEISTLELEAFRADLARSLARPIIDAARKTLGKAAPEANFEKSRTRLSEAVPAYARAFLPQVLASTKEIERVARGLALLAEFEGDLEIGFVSADVLRNFRDRHLSRMPANENQVRTKFGTTSMSSSIAAISDTDWPRMSYGERDLRMQWLYRMLKWFHSQKWIPDDPSTGLRGESVLTKAERAKATTARKDREEFTAEEIHKIFAASVFKQVALQPTKEGTFRTFQPFHYWLPLLGLFTGARIGELCQLYLADIRQQDDVWFLDINCASEDKSLKNAWSARRVPLHPALIELGLLKWCGLLRDAGYKRLFPELSWNATNRYAKEPIRAMSQLFEKTGFPRDGTKVFHSFRHGINNELQKRSSMPDMMRKRLMGHEPGESVNERHYLSDPTPREIFEYLSRLHWNLPRISAFNCDVAFQSVQDALRRKNRGRGAKEAIGPAS